MNRFQVAALVVIGALALALVRAELAPANKTPDPYDVGYNDAKEELEAEYIRKLEFAYDEGYRKGYGEGYDEGCYTYSDEIINQINQAEDAAYDVSGWDVYSAASSAGIYLGAPDLYGFGTPSPQEVKEILKCLSEFALQIDDISFVP